MYVHVHVHVYGMCMCIHVCVCVCVRVYVYICVLIITFARRLCFHWIYLFVCLFVSKIVQKTTSGFGWDFVGRLAFNQGPID